MTVYDGKHHAVDSKEIAFVMAGKKAFLDAIEKAKPIVLEPIVSLEVLCPEASMGDVAGDLSGRRGQVTGTRSLQAGHVDGQRDRAALRTGRLCGEAQGHDRGPCRVDHVVVALRARAGNTAAAARVGIREASQARRGLAAREPGEGPRGAWIATRELRGARGPARSVGMRPRRRSGCATRLTSL